MREHVPVRRWLAFVSRSSLGRAEWSGKRGFQSLKVSRRESYRKRHSVFHDVRWRAGFGNCDDAPAANHPGQRDRGGRATMDSADLRQRAITDYEVIVAAERRVRHDRQVLLLAPRQEVALNAAVAETVSDLTTPGNCALGGGQCIK